MTITWWGKLALGAQVGTWRVFYKGTCGLVQGVPAGSQRAISVQEGERSRGREVGEPRRGGLHQRGRWHVK
jgi:hypothetical protein